MPIIPEKGLHLSTYVPYYYLLKKYHKTYDRCTSWNQYLEKTLELPAIQMTSYETSNFDQTPPPTELRIIIRDSSDDEAMCKICTREAVRLLQQMEQ